MDIESIAQIIGITGFPIGMTLLMWKERREESIRRDEREKTYMAYVQANTKILTELVTLVKERLK